MSLPFRLSSMVLVLLAGVLAPGFALGQRAEAFETFMVSVGALGQVSRNGLSEAWREPAGAELAVSAPFYVGSVRMGVQAAPYRARRTDVPSFTSYYIYLGWTTGVRLPARFGIEGGFRAGLVQMRFADEEIGGAQLVEREVRADAVGVLHVDVGRGWRLGGEVSYGTLLLAEPQRAAWVRAGVSRSFRTPRALRRLLE